MITVESLKKDKNVLKSIRLKESVVREIEEIAMRDHRSFTNMVETILILCLNDKGFKKEGRLQI